MSTTWRAHAITAHHLTIDLVDGLDVVEGDDFVVQRRGDDGLAALHGDETLTWWRATFGEQLAVHWAAWTDADGIGSGPFERMLGSMVAAGWSIVDRPAPEDLTWRRPTVPAAAPVASLPARPVRPAGDRTSPWVAVPAARVVLGITEADRDALTERLVASEREQAEADGSLGFRPYDDAKRRAEIHAVLGSSVGHTELDLAAFEIPRTPAIVRPQQRRDRASRR